MQFVQPIVALQCTHYQRGKLAINKPSYVKHPQEVPALRLNACMRRLETLKKRHWYLSTW